MKFIRLKTRSLLRLQICCLSLPIKTTVLETRQFLKERDISQFIIEAKVLYSELRKYGNLFHNHFHNILRLFDVLPNCPFTTSETMRDYYL